ncbi:MAG: hypothetical protein ABL871_14410 [Terricaulis sp.]
MSHQVTEELSDDERNRRLTLMSAMRELAARELVPSLLSTGAPPERALQAALAIGENLYLLQLSDGHEPTPEIRQLVQATADLVSAYDQLGPISSLLARKLLIAIDNNGPPLDQTILSVRKLRDALTAWETTVPARGRRRLEMLPMAISASARAWRSAAGSWPAATVVEDRGPTSPLFHFYARHAGIPVSKDIFQAALRDAKREYERLTSGK